MKDISVDTKREQNQELQQKLIVYQILQKHVEELQQQAMLIERRYSELEMAKNTMDDIAKAKKGGEVMFPLGGGVYSKGSVADSNNVMVEMGSGYVARKSVREASDFLESKKNEIEESTKGLQKEMETTVTKMNTIANELKEASGQ
jgi:prefoldin alpha subunit